MRTQLALHIGFTEYKGIYNVRTGFVDKQYGELTAKMRGSPQYSIYLPIFLSSLRIFNCLKLDIPLFLLPFLSGKT